MANKKKKITDFEVLDKMFERNMDAHACFSQNIINASYDAKKGSKVTIGVSNEVGLDIGEKYIMACYFVNKDEYKKVREELENDKG